MCFTVQLSKIIFLHCRLSQTALLLYHAVLCLSRSFFNFFEVVFFSLAATLIVYHIQPAVVKNFFHFFSQLFVRRNSYILSRVFLDVKNFFHLFFIQRRRRDLNPRTAQTVYTLSRGTSSAT